MKKNHKAVGLQEIAERSGFSHVTVSRVLSGKENLHKPETVTRVRQIAEELGYRPNLLAQSMQSGVSHMVGVILRSPHGTHGGWYSSVESGIHDELVEQGYLPLTLAVSASGERDMDLLHLMLGRQVQGVILWLATEKLVQEVKRTALPLALIDIPYPWAKDDDFAGTDDDLGATLAANHLYNLGHRDVACVAFRERHTAQKRSSAFEQAAVRRPGVNCDIITCPESEDEMKDAVLRLLRSDSRPTAIFMCSDRTALLVYRAAEELGIRIPDDLSVVGYADLEFASLITPPLTTVRQDPVRMGREAARMLVERIEGRVTTQDPRHLLLAPELVVRQSTAPPRA